MSDRGPSEVGEGQAGKWVWLVMAGTHYEGDGVVSVHRTEASAKKEAARIEKAQARIRAEQQRLLDDEAVYAKEPWPVWPDNLPNCDTVYVYAERLKR